VQTTDPLVPYLTVQAGGGAPPVLTAPLTAIDALGGFATWDGTPPDSGLEAYNIAVTRQGYDSTGTAGTWVQNIWPTIRRRQAWPNNASPTATGVVLSHVIYSTDSVPGATNNSTETSPAPIFEWTMYDRTVVGDSLTARCTAYHIHGIAAVRFTATDTNGGSVSATVSTQTLRTFPRSGFAIGEFVATLDITALSETLGTTPGMISLNAEVFPRVGTTTYNTTANGTTVGTPRRLIFRKHVAMAAAPVHAYWEDGVSGGIASTDEAAARAAPSASMDVAITRAISLNNSLYGVNAVDGIRLHPKGVASFIGSVTSRDMVIAAPIVEQDTDISSRYVFASRANFNVRVLNAAGGGVAANTFIIRRCSITRSGTNSFFTNTTASAAVYLDDCDVNAGGGVAGNLGSGSPAIWPKAFNTRFTNVASGSAWFNAGTNPVTALIGCTSDNLNATDIQGYNVQGCDFTNCRVIAGGTPFILVSSRVGTFTDAAQSAFGRSAGMSTGTIIANVVFEECAATEINRWSFQADGATSNSNHFLVWHVVSAGFQDNARFNAAYNDVAGTNRQHRNWSWIGCVWKGRVPWKSDTFVQNGGDFTGNWNFGMGVNSRGNFIGFNNNANQRVEYFGLNSIVAAVGPAVSAQFVNDQSSNNVGTPTAGGGDYALQLTSPAKSIVTQTPMPWTITGVLRPATGADAGAY
jgi:hypothetical protein